MCRGGGILVAALLAAALVLARPVRADPAALRVLCPVDLFALPLLVMQHEHLIERVAEAMGVGEVTVTWSTPGAAGPIKALAAGQADLVVAPLADFLVAADTDAGTPAEIRAIGAVAQRPYILVTRNPKIATIRDFGEHDRIAVPALKTSGPALMLEMAAAQEWGIAHYDKLDRLMVARPDAAAMDELLSGKGEIDAHFSHSPYADAELGDKAVHRVMDSFDIAGPHSVAVLAATARLYAGNPMLGAAILSALQAADDFIKKTPGAAAEIFAAMAKDQDIPVEEASDMIGDPDLAYKAAPAGVTRLAEFMHRLGRLKREPTSWKDFFIRAARDLPGN